MPGSLPRVSDRLLVALAVTLAVALALTVLVSLLVWHTPTMHHVDVPSVPKG